MERSLTKCEPNQLEGLDRKKKNADLKKWIAESDDDDALIEITSENEEEAESPFIPTPQKVDNIV